MRRLSVGGIIHSESVVTHIRVITGKVLQDPDDPTELFSIEGRRETVLAALGDQSGIRSVDFLSTEGEETYVYVREVGQERTLTRSRRTRSW